MHPSYCVLNVANCLRLRLLDCDRALDLAYFPAMQDEIMRTILLEEHANFYGDKNVMAKGFVIATLRRMHALYEPNQADHTRVLAALPGPDAVNNKITKLIPGRVWPHVAAAQAAAADAAANAKAARREEAGLGIGLPAPAVKREVFTPWMDEFIAKGLIAEGPTGWRFVDHDISKHTASVIVARVRNWVDNVPSSRTRCEVFETKIRAAFVDRWQTL